MTKNGTEDRTGSENMEIESPRVDIEFIRGKARDIVQNIEVLNDIVSSDNQRVLEQSAESAHQTALALERNVHQAFGHMVSSGLCVNCLGEETRPGQAKQAREIVEHPEILRAFNRMGVSEELKNGPIMREFKESKVTIVNAGGVPGILIDPSKMGSSGNIKFRGIVPPGRPVSEDEIRRNLNPIVDRIFGPDRKVDISMVRPSDAMTNVRTATRQITTFFRNRQERLQRGEDITQEVLNVDKWIIIAVAIGAILLCLAVWWFWGWSCIIFLWVAI